ncbi:MULTISPECIES: hypothetical protein [Pseudomonas]|uniref:hypothetical protein n=1 Tax=Pseudomonas TaxID=286 RepID=UPI00351C9686
MKHQILAIGAGFGGEWSAARLLDQYSHNGVEITLLALQARLRIPLRWPSGPGRRCLSLNIGILGLLIAWEFCLHQRQGRPL